MTRDEFETWLVDPVTRWVFAGIGRAQEQEKAEWIRRSWDTLPRHSPEQMQMALLELRTRHDALGELVDNDFETWRNWNGESADPDDDE